MTALVFIIITLLFVIKDECSTKKKRRENQAAAQKRVAAFNECMQKLKDIQTKDHIES